MSICEQDSPLSQSFDIGSHTLRMATQPDDPIIQVIDGYQEYIRPGGLLCAGGEAP